MSDRDRIHLPDAEWQVMLAVWQADEQAAGEIIDRVLQQRDWNHRTIRTLLARLVEKGAVDVRVDGAKYLYRAAVTREACVRSAAKSFAERFFGGSPQSMLLHFVENEELSDEELDQLRLSLDARKQRASQGKNRKRGRRRKEE